MGNKLNDTGLRIVWNKVWSLVKSITGDVNVTEKGTLQKQIDDLKTDCFQSVSDGKALVASAITDKGVKTAPDATFATMAANIDAIETEMSLQSKSVSLSTSAQTVKPDSGYDGLSQVSVPAVTGTAAVGDVVVGKTFNSATAGIGKTGTLADKTGTPDYSATASLDATNSRLKMKIPAQGKYGTGNYLYAAYSTIASLIGLTAAKLVKGNTILGITGNSNNMDTSGGDATAAQILSGKKACVDGELRTGTMTNRQGTTVDATAVSQDDTYTYFTTPAGSYSTKSKVRTPNSNLMPYMINKIMSLMEVVKLPYTASEEGYVTVTCTYSLNGWASGMYVYAYIYLNGELIESASGTTSAKADITQKVSVGDVITVSGKYSNNSGQSNPTMSSTATCYFVPLD